MPVYLWLCIYILLMHFITELGYFIPDMPSLHTASLISHIYPLISHRTTQFHGCQIVLPLFRQDFPVVLCLPSRIRPFLPLTQFCSGP